jgi:ADP-heptose:LPS heptosyltransferase
MGDRVTVVRPGGLGDTILTLPALRRRTGARLTLVGSSWAEAIRPLVPFPVVVVRVDGAALLPLFDPSAEKDPTGLFSEADEVILYTDTPGEALAANARRFCRKAVLWPVTPPSGVHAADHFAAAMGEGGPAVPELRAPAEFIRWGREWIEGRFGPGTVPAAIHPGSGGRRKCWPAARFAEVARRLQRPVVAVEGPADGEACREFLAEAGGVRVERASGLTIPQLAGLLAGCGVLVGNDSGVSHLSAALGVPTVAVFGPTDPAVWAPRGPRASNATWAGGVNEIASRFC